MQVWTLLQEGDKHFKLTTKNLSSYYLIEESLHNPTYLSNKSHKHRINAHE